MNPGAEPAAVCYALLRSPQRPAWEDAPTQHPGTQPSSSLTLPPRAGASPLSPRHLRLWSIRYGPLLGCRHARALRGGGGEPANVVLANRDLASALRFVERISTYLAEFEEKISHTHIVLVGEGTAHTHT